MPKPGALRASDADRDRVVDRLHKAATEGRIVAEELELRVSTALKARTYDELAATVADLPGPRSPERRPSTRRSAGPWVLSTVRANPMLLLFVIPAVAVTAAMVLAATVVWAVLMVVVLALGGRRRAPHPPWAYGHRAGWGPPHRRARNDWA